MPCIDQAVNPDVERAIERVLLGKGHGPPDRALGELTQTGDEINIFLFEQVLIQHFLEQDKMGVRLKMAESPVHVDQRMILFKAGADLFIGLAGR